jgi:ribose-phosphate pyrophosphokinase
MTSFLHAFRDEEAPARRLAEALGAPLAFVETHQFPDGELLPRIPPAAATTLVYRSLDRPNTKLVELILAAEAWRRNGARRLVLVAPYLCYMRQDKPFSPGEPVSQQVIAALLDGTFDRIVTVDPHLHRTPRLADLFEHSEATHLHGADALDRSLDPVFREPNLVVVGPDEESASWTSRIANRLSADHVTLVKHRRTDRTVDLATPAGLLVADRPVLLVDDICSSGGTLIAATRLLRAAGAASVTILVTHALCGPDVVRDLLAAGARRIISSDSCEHPTNGVWLASLLATTLRTEVENSPR